MLREILSQSSNGSLCNLYNMKSINFFILLFVITACDHPANQNQELIDRINALEQKLADSYKPGFGELMSSMQNHHAKLWFAGIHDNWKLAEFESREIVEIMDNIQKYQAQRKESGLIGSLSPAIDSIYSAINQKNQTHFKSSFQYLTNSCNHCHQLTKFEFNWVKIPEQQFFSNQDFEVKENH